MPVEIFDRTESRRPLVVSEKAGRWWSTHGHLLDRARARTQSLRATHTKESIGAGAGITDGLWPSRLPAISAWPWTDRKGLPGRSSRPSTNLDRKARLPASSPTTPGQVAFGLRLRSCGFVLRTTPAQVEAPERLARITLLLVFADLYCRQLKKVGLICTESAPWRSKSGIGNVAPFLFEDFAPGVPPSD